MVSCILTIRLQHANFAITYINAAKYLMDDTALEQCTGTNIFELSQSIEKRQKSLSAQIRKKCPHI